jgi:hypothetical protein
MEIGVAAAMFGYRRERTIAREQAVPGRVAEVATLPLPDTCIIRYRRKITAAAV